MNIRHSNIFLASCAALYLAISCASAQPASDDATNLAQISVTHTRNPQEFDFSKAQKIIEKYNNIPPNDRDKIRLAFYLRPKKGRLPDDLQLDITSGDTTLPVDIRDTGEVVFPPMSPQQASKATVMSNVERGILSIDYKVDIQLPVAAPDVAYLSDALREARAAWKKTYGVGAFLVPNFDCVELRFREPTTVSWANISEDHLSPIWTAPPASDVKVPLHLPNLSQQTTLHWGENRPIRAAACKTD